MTSPERSRLVTAVVVDSNGAVRGQTAPTVVALPYWQEAGPIADTWPGSVVLRLLEAEADPDAQMGGTVTYLVHNDQPMDLQPWTGRLDAQALRLPWADVGGPDADLRWVASQVEVTGPARQHRTWNLSAIWSVPTATGTVWLKCVPPFLQYEAAVLNHLADADVPQVLAHDGHRTLLAQLPGEDGYDATDAQYCSMVDALIEIQLSSAVDSHTLLAQSVPDLRSEALAQELHDLVFRRAPHNPVLLEFVAALPQRLAQEDACGLPNLLVHGDAHPGNCRLGSARPLWFDWGDSFIGNPLLDLGAATDRPAVQAHWLDAWAAAIPGSDPHKAWDLLRPVAQLRNAWVYQRFVDNIEPSEHVYHDGDVPDALEAAAALIAAEA